ncbi:MAG: 1-deoxy-D-xylulose-5-phosphate synthase [Actinobacteria bacterium]|nr:1-deoxy-D-xylulose-5-phosphate synthase [Actinomycetota bacterium]
MRRPPAPIPGRRHVEPPAGRRRGRHVLLERIDAPADVKALSYEQLDDLAGEIRSFILEAVSRTGGHLGSNLGAVELTLALHRVLESPDDMLLWDTGHQAYVHKLLTGRRDLFGSLRQAGGLSGYPSRAESAHDHIENSHASTALSYAFGLARGMADRAAEERRRIVAVVGDGALTGGMAYEALNNIGHSSLPVTIVLNDNGRSYAHTVSRLSHQVSRLRLNRRYRRLRTMMDEVLARLPIAERIADAGLEGLKTAVSQAPALQSFVESLGVRYTGPVDGHDVPAIEEALHSAVGQDGPVLVHVLTQKGKGYEPAETDPEKCLHDTSAFDVATGRAVTDKPRSWTQVFSETIDELAEERPELIALTAAMPGSTGLLPLAGRSPGQVVDVGIAEQNAVTGAAGMAMAGRIPVVAVYSTFFSRAFDQANLDVGLHGAHVVFVFDRAGITGDDGPSHHGILDMALCLRIPDMTVLAPSSEEELASMLRQAMDLPGPVAIRYPKGATVSRGEARTDLRAARLRQGAEAAIVAVGDRAGAALEAAEILSRDGIEVAVHDVRAVRPVDPRLLDALAGAPLVVTVENGIVSGGAGAFIADRLVERTGVNSAPPILKLGVPDGYIAHASPHRILAELGLDGTGIATATRKALNGDA